MNHAGELAALARRSRSRTGRWCRMWRRCIWSSFRRGLRGLPGRSTSWWRRCPKGGIAVLNADDARVAGFGAGLEDRAVMYGMAETAEVRAQDVVEAGVEGLRFTAVADGERAETRLHLLGRHNVSNALAAIAVGWKSGLTLAECASALGEMHAPEKRGVLAEWRGATLINDCYNSNPAALDAMVDALLAVAGRRIVVAGEMLELGPEGAALHYACGVRMRERGVDRLVGVRGLAGEMVRGFGARAVFVETPKEAGAWMLREVRAGDAVLLKASRGVQLEEALEVLAKA